MQLLGKLAEGALDVFGSGVAFDAQDFIRIARCHRLVLPFLRCDPRTLGRDVNPPPPGPSTPGGAAAEGLHSNQRLSRGPAWRPAKERTMRLPVALSLAAVLFLNVPASAQSQGAVYLLPIKGVIGVATAGYVERGLTRAAN